MPQEASEIEEQALEALDAGDFRGALTLLMDAYGNAVYRFCRHLVADAELAEDAHQMTFVQAFESLQGFSRRSTLRTWLFSIARHRCLDAAKINRRRQARFQAVPELPDSPLKETPPDERLAAAARQKALNRCLGKLQAKVRAAILLRYQQDLSYPEMARAAGEQPATLQARVARAMPVLRRCLEGQGAVP